MGRLLDTDVLSKSSNPQPSSAIAHGHTLVTRKVGDYPEDVSLLNPWED